MVHYPPIKMTNQIVQHSTSQKDHLNTLDKSKLTRWYFLLDFLINKTMNCNNGDGIGFVEKKVRFENTIH